MDSRHSEHGRFQDSFCSLRQTDPVPVHNYTHRIQSCGYQTPSHSQASERSHGLSPSPLLTIHLVSGHTKPWVARLLPNLSTLIERLTHVFKFSPFQKQSHMGHRNHVLILNCLWQTEHSWWRWVKFCEVRNSALQLSVSDVWTLFDYFPLQ